jgi:type IV pilus assembly protein PilO
MNLIEELRSLDPREPGRWPLPIRIGAVVIWLVLLTFILGYFFVWTNESPILTQYQNEEQSLRQEFRTKHAQAVNLSVYKQQLGDIERSFGALLRQLPGRTEVPNLLVEISQAGVGAGLSEKLFQPGTEVKKDFYAELPIRIRLSGSYHQFGQFVSGIAALPRIVTLHDIEIHPAGAAGAGGAGFDNLTLDLTAKTYRYLDQDELGGGGAEPNKNGAHK